MVSGADNFNTKAPIGVGRRARVSTTMVGALLIAAIVPALSESQTETVEQSAKAQAGKDVRIGVYLNVKPDCTSGPLPTIRLSTAPANGTVTVRKANVSATNYKKCLALQVPAFVAIYRSRANFSGVDVLDLEVKYENGRVQIHKFKIEVGASPASQPI
jgi:uncharacterized membrane protein